MSRRLETSIIIDATPNRVWHVLEDFQSYSEWSTFIRDISGRMEEGSRLSVFLQPPGGKGMQFEPVVLQARAPTDSTSDTGRRGEFRWRGSLGAGFIFSGEHSFVLEAADAGRTRLTHNEIFRGLLVPFLWRSLDTSTRRGFEEFNRALKQRCEMNLQSARFDAENP